MDGMGFMCHPTSPDGLGPATARKNAPWAVGCRGADAGSDPAPGRSTCWFFWTLLPRQVQVLLCGALVGCPDFPLLVPRTRCRGGHRARGVLCYCDMHALPVSLFFL